MSETRPGREPTPEELQALEQLREADAAVIVLQALEILGSGAMVKLGRPDARVLIDALSGLADSAAAALPEELRSQLRQEIGQLQLAQVQAEQELQRQPAESAQPEAGRSQPTDAAGASKSGTSARGPSSAGGQQSQRPGQEDERLTDRLWIPGREPGPRPPR